MIVTLKNIIKYEEVDEYSFDVFGIDDGNQSLLYFRENLLQKNKFKLQERKMPYCTKCGSEYKLGQKQCLDCGNELNYKPFYSTDNLGIKGEVKATKLVRILAAIIDIAIAFLLILTFLSPRLRMFKLVGASQYIMIAIPSLYLLLKDCIDGKSIGKLFFKISVYNKKEGKTSGLADSILRNWFLALPILGPTIFAFILMLQIIINNRRWGDNLSSTIVIFDRNLEKL